MALPLPIPRTLQALGLASLLVAPALTADSVIDATQSSIVAIFKQEGVPVEAPFTGFSGRIVYDANDVSASSATIEVATGSLDLGDETYNEEVRRPEWFDSASHPNATFQSTVIEPTGDGGFKATGELTIKGVKQPITIPISVSPTAGRQAFDGALDVSRTAFGIGEPMWDEVLEDKVTIRFHLVVMGQSGVRVGSE